MKPFLLSLLASITTATVATATPIPDQFYSGPLRLNQGIGGAPGSFGDPVVAQTFTVGVHGTFNSVDVFLEKSLPGRVFGVDLVAEIRPVVGGVPGESTLASVLVPEAKVPLFGRHSFVNIDFSTFALPVSVGDELAIVLYDDDKADPNIVYVWGGNVDSGYLGGSRFFDIGGGFTPLWDLYFRTYVSVPEPSPLALLTLALVGLGWRPRRTRLRAR